MNVKTDRFVPSGGASAAARLHLLTNRTNQATLADQLLYQRLLSDSLFGVEHKKNILEFKPVRNAPRLSNTDLELREKFEGSAGKREGTPAPWRKIPTGAFRVLDAPNIINDFYLHFLDWSCQNTLAIALGFQVYLWQAETKSITLLVSDDRKEHISSVRWLTVNGRATSLAVGDSGGTVQIWDVNSGKLERSIQGHADQVGALDWSAPLLTSGGRTGKIMHSDVRAHHHLVSQTSLGNNQVCGLRWSPGGGQLAVGNDNNECVLFDRCRTTDVQGRLDGHAASVKALAWHPTRDNLLATGGGSADRKIRVFDTAKYKCTDSRDTKWSRCGKELLSAHGFTSNHLVVWNFPRLEAVATLTGHQQRVLDTCLSPDGTTVCSVAADETMQFWNVFEPAKKAPPSERLYFKIR